MITENTNEGKAGNVQNEAVDDIANTKKAIHEEVVTTPQQQHEDMKENTCAPVSKDRSVSIVSLLPEDEGATTSIRQEEKAEAI